MRVFTMIKEKTCALCGKIFQHCATFFSKNLNLTKKIRLIKNVLQISRVSFHVLSTMRLSERTRRERLKSALYLTLKKRKRFFEKKLEIFELFFFQKPSHSAEKCERGTLWALLTYILLQNMKKLEGGTLLRLKIFSEKSRTGPKEIQRGDPLGTSGVVGYVKIVKNERGTLLH